MKIYIYFRFFTALCFYNLLGCGGMGRVIPWNVVPFFPYSVCWVGSIVHLIQAMFGFGSMVLATPSVFERGNIAKAPKCTIIPSSVDGASSKSFSTTIPSKEKASFVSVDTKSVCGCGSFSNQDEKWKRFI